MSSSGFTFESRGRARILRVESDVDIYTGPSFEAAIASADEGDAEVVIVDLGGCRYLDSTGLAILIGKHKRMKSTLFVVAPKDAFVRRLFVVTGLDKTLRVFDDVDAVFASGAVTERQAP